MLSSLQSGGGQGSCQAVASQEMADDSLPRPDKAIIFDMSHPVAKQRETKPDAEACYHGDCGSREAVFFFQFKVTRRVAFVVLPSKCSRCGRPTHESQ